MCKITVLVPVYNMKRYLPQCLDSLMAQTFMDVEFLCLDDGSTDGSAGILEAYAAKDKRFRIVHKPNSGYGASMNLGLRMAHGEYIGVVEADDFAAPEMFATLFAAATASGAEITKSNYYWYDEAHGSRFRELLEGCPYGVLCSAQTVPRLMQTDAYIWSSLYRKDFLRDHGIWFRETPGAAYQDVSFCMKAVVSARRIFLLKEAFIHYRIDNAGASVKRADRNVVELFHAEFRSYWDFLRAQAPEVQQAGAAVASNMWRIYGGACWKNLLDGERPAYMVRLRKEYGELEHEGWIKKELWPEDAWNEMDCVVHHTGEMALSEQLDRQKPQIIRMGVLANLRNAPRVCLCGAGRVAKQMLAALSREGIAVSAFLVSDPLSNPPVLAGIPVRALADAADDCGEAAVFLAISPKTPFVQQELYLSLAQAGYRNIIVLTDELRRALV